MCWRLSVAIQWVVDNREKYGIRILNLSFAQTPQVALLGRPGQPGGNDGVGVRYCGRGGGWK